MGAAHRSGVRQRYRTFYGEAKHTLSYSTEWPLPTLRPQPYPFAKRLRKRKQSACQS